jgi:predicted metal-dependent hydrolase
VSLAIRKDKHGGLHEDSVISNGIVIPYRYCHSRRRTLGITVRPDKSVSVRVPLRTPLHEIRAFVAGRAAWIAKVWAEFDRRSPVQLQSYADGATFLFQGSEYRLVLETGPLEAVRLQGKSLVVTTTDQTSPARLPGVVDAWYLERAREIFGVRLIACHRRMQPEGIPLPPVTIRPMKSRWGSYSYRTRRISLNLNLIKLPQECLDYVIIHELCHINVRHHGPGFWRLVGRYVLDHVEIRRKLRSFIPSYL